jgi:DNA invertase Pin-like site-specific DNA recombinase
MLNGMADTPTTTQDFLGMLQTLFPNQDTRDIDPTTLRYVIYACKSTKGEERQERSIPDQIDDCMKREVIPNGLHIVGKPIREKGSAKEPDIRPKFRDMLDDIKAGKIDGIVTWHTDRLARNMKEAGEIIDLLDKGVLKDLRFATSTFENSPTGKMLLGISFVLSKQYSEHLSESVTRGNTKKTEDGIFFDEMKHGYYINDGKLFPDGDNFILIKEAFAKRLDGWGQLEIAKWLNTTGYTLRKKGKKPQSYKWDKDNVSKLLRDTANTGVLKYGKTYVDLTEFYDFEAVISVDDFLKVNKVKDLADPKLVSAVMVKPRDSTKADMLRSMVICGYCDKPCVSGITTKRDKETKKIYEARYYYRCETDGCTYKNKSIRAKVVIDHAAQFLDEHLFTTETNYDDYVVEAKEYAAVQAHALDGDIAALTRQLGNKQTEYDRTKAAIRDNPQLARHYNLDQVEDEQKAIDTDLKKLVSTRKHLKQAVMTYSEYLELFSFIGVELPKTRDMQLVDETVRKFFLNFTITDHGAGKKQRYEITHNLKEPWAKFVKTDNFVSGRGERT